MSSFAGIILLAEGDLSPSTVDAVDTSTDCGYHLLVVQDYSLTKEVTPSGRGICSRAFVVGGHTWYIEYYPNGESSKCADYISLHVSVLDDDEDYQKTVKAKVCISFIDQVEKHKPMYICGTGTRTFGGSAFMRLDKFMKKDIKDMEAKVFKALLSFIYTDSFPEMEEEDEAQVVEQGQEEDEMRLRWLQDLLVAADRYDVQGLKFICEKQFSERICLSSVMSTLALAEQHHCRRLKQACFKFMQVQSPSHWQTVMASSGWDHVFTTYPSVLKELIAKLIALNQRKELSGYGTHVP